MRCVLCAVLNLRAYLLTSVLGAMREVEVQGDMGLLFRLAWACALDGLGEHLQLFALLGWVEFDERARRGGRAGRAVRCVELARVPRHTRARCSGLIGRAGRDGLAVQAGVGVRAAWVGRAA